MKSKNETNIILKKTFDNSEYLISEVDEHHYSLQIESLSSQKKMNILFLKSGLNPVSKAIESNDLKNIEKIFPQYFAEKSVIIMQKMIRGYLSRKKYQIKNLECPSYDKAFVVGNDPIIPIEKLNVLKQSKKIAIIGSSVLRSVELACHLSDSDSIPKIIIIDNSILVCKFWYSLKKIVEKNKEQKEFINDLLKFLEKGDTRKLYRFIGPNDLKNNSHCNTYPNQHIPTYFRKLFKMRNYETIAKIIKHVSVFNQDWSNEQVFIKLKNILHYNHISEIFMYPSNILSCIGKKNINTCETILKNIETINPKAAIHTNLCLEHKLPEKVFFFTHNNYHQVHEELFKDEVKNNI